MTDELFGKYISAELQEIFNDNAVEIAQKLQEVAPNKLDIETVQLVARAMSISSQISVQYVLRALENAGIISLPPDGVPILSVHKNQER